MSRRAAVIGYVVAWIVGALAIAVFFGGGSVKANGTTASAVASTQSAAIAAVALLIATLVMLFTWVAALVALTRQRAWGWFVCVLILQLVGLGIAAMLLYAVAEPRRPVLTVTRPSVT